MYASLTLDASGQADPQGREALFFANNRQRQWAFLGRRTWETADIADTQVIQSGDAVRGHAPQLGAIPVLAQWLVKVLADEAVRANRSPVPEPRLQGKYREICQKWAREPEPNGRRTA